MQIETAADDGRIDESGQHLGAQRVAFLDIVGQPFHDARQVAGVLAGLDQRAIDGRKRVARARGQRIGKALAAAYIGAHGGERYR